MFFNRSRLIKIIISLKSSKIIKFWKIIPLKRLSWFLFMIFHHYCKTRAYIKFGRNIFPILILISVNLCQHCGIICFWDEQSSRSSSESIFLGSSIRLQFLSGQHLNLGSASMEHTQDRDIFNLLLRRSLFAFICKRCLCHSFNKSTVHSV